MRTIAFISFKGGAGKSTAAMALCSSLSASGHTTTMIDADENAPLTAWKELGVAQDLWDPLCDVVRGDDMQSLEAGYISAEDRGSAFTIVDTRGGGSELNNTVIANVDAVVIPSALTGLDIEAALSTFEYGVRLLQEMDLSIPIVLLIQRVPVGRMTVSQTQDLEALSTLPRLPSVLHARDAFGAISKRGMLHCLLEKVRADPRKRLTTNHLSVAMEEAHELRKGIEGLLTGAVG